MNDSQDKQVKLIEALFDKKVGWITLIICLISIFILALISQNISLNLLWIRIILFLIIFITIFILLILARTFCPNCNKNVYPIFTGHYCQSLFKDMKRKIRNYLYYELYEEILEIKEYINEIGKIKILNNEKEKEILKNNLISLRIFEHLTDYKYTLIAMGSILEFLLIRYCNLYNITPVSYTDSLGNQTLANKKKLVNYLQSAIKKDLFNRRGSWYIIQNNLRNFRNYVHIIKEIKDEQIDKEWYKTIKPHFEKFLGDFKTKTKNFT